LREAVVGVMSDLLPIGTPAPDFTSVDQNGNPIALKDYRGRTVVLYFYPRDDTPGCTAEACAFRDDLEEFKGRNVAILGVSVDDAESHKRFQEKYGLNFTLVADPKKEITREYGALNLFGVARRVTYIIDGRGNIRHVYEKVQPRDHSREILQTLTALGA
jgi:peroxiredoxin Q/BCP